MQNTSSFYDAKKVADISSKNMNMLQLDFKQLPKDTSMMMQMLKKP